jgi:ribosomal protein L11/uncharacterized integral membrane protein
LILNKTYRNIKIKQLLLLLFFCIIDINTEAQELKIAAKTDKNEYLVGDYITLTLNVTFDVSNTCKFPEIGDTLGTFDVISKSPIDEKKVQEQIAQTQTITLSGYDSALMLVPPLIFVDKINKKYATEPIPLMIKTVPVDTLQPIRPIAPIEEVPRGWNSVLWFIAIFHLLLILLALFIHYRKKEKFEPNLAPPVDTTQPHVWAEIQLKKLDAMQLCNKNKTKEHYIAYSIIIREYIERRFEVSTAEATTEELLKLFKKVAKGYHKEKQKLGEILNLADFVKFAKVRPSDEENELAMRDALLFIDNTKLEKQAEPITNLKNKKR